MDSSQSDKARLLEITRALLADVNEDAEDWSTAVAGHDSDGELATLVTEEQVRLRTTSGTITDSRPLVTLLYVLMRDHILRVSWRRS